MNYLSIYKSVIRKAKSEQEIRRYNRKHKLEYYEVHHPIPHSIMLLRKPWVNNNRKRSNWINGPWNSVLLTAPEHLLVHRMLTKFCEKIYGTKHQYTIKMIHSFDNFLYRRADNRANYKMTSRLYEYLKKASSKDKSKQFTEMNNISWSDPDYINKKRDDWFKNVLSLWEDDEYNKMMKDVGKRTWDKLWSDPEYRKSHTKENHPQAVKIDATSPQGEHFLIQGNILGFTKDHNLGYGTLMRELIDGIPPTTKSKNFGWHFKYVEKLT